MNALRVKHYAEGWKQLPKLDYFCKVIEGAVAVVECAQPGVDVNGVETCEYIAKFSSLFCIMFLE